MDDLGPMGLFSDADFAAIISQLRAEELISRNNAGHFEDLIKVLDSRGANSERDHTLRRELVEAARGAEARARERAAERERWERLREQAQ